MRDELAASGPLHGDPLIGLLKTTVDDIRREWISADRPGWLKLNLPYGPLEEVRRLVAEPERAR